MISRSGTESNPLSGKECIAKEETPRTAAACCAQLLRSGASAESRVGDVRRRISSPAGASAESLRMQMRTSSPRRQCHAIVPPAPNTSSSPWAATTSTLLSANALSFDQHLRLDERQRVHLAGALELHRAQDEQTSCTCDRRPPVSRRPHWPDDVSRRA